MIQIGQRQIIKRQLPDQPPCHFAFSQRRLRRARRSDKTHARHRNRRINGQIIPAITWNKAGQIAVSHHCRDGDMAQIFRVGRFMLINQRQEDFRAGIGVRVP